MPGPEQTVASIYGVLLLQGENSQVPAIQLFPHLRLGAGPLAGFEPAFPTNRYGRLSLLVHSRRVPQPREDRSKAAGHERR